MLRDQVGWGIVQLNLGEAVPAHNKEDGTRWLFKVPSNLNHYVILILLQDHICMQVSVYPTFCRVLGLLILQIWRPESTPVINKSISWNMELHLTVVLPNKIISLVQTAPLTLAIKLFVIYIGHGYLSVFSFWLVQWIWMLYFFFSHLHIPFPSAY